MTRRSKFTRPAGNFVPSVAPLEDRITPAAGDLDLSFNATGKTTVAFDLGAAGNRSDLAADVVAQADGKVVVAGRAQIGASSFDFAVVRLNADGSPDATFGTGGKQTVAFDLGSDNTDIANAIAIQPDGKIVVAGYAEQTVPGNYDFAVARLNADGTPDATFGPGGARTVAFDLGGAKDDYAAALAVQADGKVVLAGSAQVGAAGDSDFAVARLNPDGGLDTTFNVTGKKTVAFNLGGVNSESAAAVAIQPDGKVVLGGFATRSAAGNNDFAAARLNPDGGLDTTFNATGKKTVAFDFGGFGNDTDLATGVAILPNRKIVLAGYADRAAAGETDFAVARLLGDNAPPVAVADAAGVLLNTPVTVNVLINDSDPDGDTLAVAVTVAPAHGTVVFNPDQTITYTPAAGYVGTDTFSYQVSDGLEGTATAAVAITVSAAPPVNLPPVAGADFAFAVSGSPVTINVLANDSDPNGDTLAVAVTAAPAHGTAVVNPDKTVTYTPTAGYFGTDSIVYAVDDGHGGTATATVAITVFAAPPFPTDFFPPPANLPPVAGADLAVTGANSPVTINVLANDSDPDGDTLAVSAILSAPAHGAAVIGAGGVVTYTPAAGFSGADNFVYQVSDGKGGFAAANVAVTVTAPLPPAPGTLYVLPRQFAVGLDRGGDGTVRLQNPDQGQRFSATPFAGSAAAGVRTATADFNGDGVADLVVGTGPGGATQVRVLDGKTQSELFSVQPFEASFTGGVYVAAGDVTGDGVADLVITPDEGGGPRVRVFSGAGFALIADFFGIDDPNFRGGARAAVGDINGDGVGDLVVAAGFGGGPRVAVFDGKTLAGTPGRLIGDFLAFEATLRNGAFIAAGDLDGDGRAEVVAGGGPGGGPRVTAFSGSEIAAGRQTPTANFFGGDPTNRGGIRVAVKDLDGDTKGDVLTGSGPGGGSRVTAYAGSQITPGATPPELFAFDAQPGFLGGAFVG